MHRNAPVTIAALLCIAGIANAATQTWQVDQSQSQLVLTSGSVQVSIFNFPAMPTAPGSFTAPLTGFINADLIEGAETTIQLLDSTRVTAVDHDAYLPGTLEDPATSAPGSFAVKFNTAAFTGSNAMGVTRGLVLTTEDEARTITAGSFDADGQFLSIFAGVADFNIDPPQADLADTPTTKNLTLDPATLVRRDGIETLTIPIEFELNLTADIAVVNLQFAGLIVATRTLPVICPGDIAGNDLAVDIDDLNAILSAFNSEVGVGNPLDIANNDGVVDIDDLNVVLANFGAACN